MRGDCIFTLITQFFFLLPLHKLHQEKNVRGKMNERLNLLQESIPMGCVLPAHPLYVLQ